MPRTLKNTLTEAELLDMFAGHGADDVLARYGADLLGRAIGHEMARERALGLGPTMFYTTLIHATGHTGTRKLMAFDAAREVMAI